MPELLSYRKALGSGGDSWEVAEFRKDFRCSLLGGILPPGFLNCAGGENLRYLPRGTGRLQTVTESQNPLYYRLIRKFGKRTGIPMVLNTSFNENEPIVNRPEEALDCFLRTKMGILALGSTIIEMN